MQEYRVWMLKEESRKALIYEVTDAVCCTLLSLITVSSALYSPVFSELCTSAGIRRKQSGNISWTTSRTQKTLRLAEMVHIASVKQCNWVRLLEYCEYKVMLSKKLIDIADENTHRSHSLFTLLPQGRRSRLPAQCNLKVFVLNLIISIFCFFIIPLKKILEASTVRWTPLCRCV